MRQPEDFWRVDEEFAGLYAEKVERGRKIASASKVCVLAIARNAEKNVLNTLDLFRFLGAQFDWPRGYVFENDSEDATAEILTANRPAWMHMRSDANGRPHLHGFEPERTDALAQYRDLCRQWAVSHVADADYVVVADVDADGGFSVDGILNSIGWLAEIDDAAGMASTSLYKSEKAADGSFNVAHADAWAARLNHWSDRRTRGSHHWFHQWIPPVGSPPVRFYSAFGGLAVYRAQDYYAGEYTGGDCEHVTFHRSVYQATGRHMYLNPGSRFATIIK
jgi:hypothetical protein